MSAAVSLIAKGVSLRAGNTAVVCVTATMTLEVDGSGRTGHLTENGVVFDD